jgi:hypothetical protein
MASLWSDAWTVRRVASRCLACKWTVPNLAWWSVPNFTWWSVPNLHACMRYLYACMCGCTADTCLLVLCMLVVYACCLCAFVVCVVNGKNEYCLGGCFCLASFAAYIRMCCGHAWRKKIEGKVGGGTRCRGGVRAPAVGEGVRARVRVATMVVGSAHAPLSGIGRSERGGREMRNGWVMSMSRCMIN